MIGKTISHYRILEKLGEGGMGVVYKAQDTKLKRTVALKFLTPQALGSEEERTRLVQEAQAAAALNHPHIATIYEIDEVEGETFIAMGYIDGQSLKQKIESGPLKLDQALEIAIQVAEGLQEAHDMGIVHRDIKSANIMVTSKGQAKIMDFGLAKLAGRMEITKTGTTMGTAAYMSPEQARGEPVDHRTDIWSLGVVLYEMLSGQLPFKSEYEQAVVYSILNEEPEPIKNLRPSVPIELERLIAKTLAKSTDERYQHINDVLVDLRKLRKELESNISKEQPSTKKPQPSIAVLPFTNLSADKEQEYFCDGMAEEIINALTHVEGLRVVARTSAFSFRGKEIDIREIGKKLNVGTLLEGSVRKAGNRLRISAQLVNVADGYHLWSEKYDRDIGELCCPEDIFAIQDGISLAIVDKLKVKLLGGEKAKLIKRHTEDLDAYNLYLKGRYFWNKRTEESLTRAIGCFEQAITEDPNFALAYAGLADSYNLLGFYGVLPPKETFPKAKASAIRALELDEVTAEAHTSLAFARLYHDWNWMDAEKEFKRAFELNPRYPTAHHWYAEYLASMGRTDEVINEAKQALKFDPLSLIINTMLGFAFYLSHQYDQAMEQLHRTLEMDANFVPAHFFLGLVYVRRSMFEKAIAEFERAIILFPGSTLWLAALGHVFAVSGKRDEAQRVVEELKEISRRRYVPLYYVAAVYADLGDKDQAFEWLEKSYEECDSWLVFLRVDPLWDSLRSDPRFTKLLKKMRLEK
jgi:serine/threonine protein kinase/tetratricopeptide (TPR) repeat protein